MSLLRKASIVTTPTAYENGKILSVKPSIVLGEELVVNGTFDSDTAWSKGAGWSISNGTASHTGGTTSYLSQSILEPNKQYKVKIKVSQASGNNFVQIYMGNSPASVLIQNVGEYEYIFTSQSSTGLGFALRGALDIEIDNVSVKEVLDSDFDFTRNSSATRVNSQGLIEDMQILSGDLISNGDFSQEGSELITNGDFATDSDWTKSGGATISNGMANFLTGSSKIAQSISAPTQDRVYRVEFDSNQINLSTTAVLIYGSGFYGSSNIPSVGKNILYIKTNISGGSQTNKIQLTGGSNGTLDNVSVKEVGQDWALGTDWSIGTNELIATSMSNQFVTQSFTFTSGKRYRASFTVTGTSSLPNDTSLRMPYDGNSANRKDVPQNSDGVHINEFVSNGSSTLYLGYGSFTGSITNIKIIEITEDTNLPRIDYTGGEGHWLFEPQSTNLVTYSEDFSQWGQSGAPALTSGQLAPDGTFGATKISGTIGSSYIALAQASTTTATRTIYAKTVSGTGTAKLMSYSGNTNNLFTLTEEWQRFELTGSSAVGATSFYIDLRDNAQTLSEFIIWGAQSEELSFATSYIPTNGSTVTRLADAAFGAGSSDLINSTEGVLYAEIAALTQTPDANQSIALSDGTGNNNIVRIRFLKTSDNTIRVQVRSGGAITVSVSGIVTDIKDFHKVAISYKVNEVKFYIDGVLIHTDTIADMPIGLNQLSFSDGNGILNNFFGKTKCVAVFKEALTDAELTCLTTI